MQFFPMNVDYLECMESNNIKKLSIESLSNHHLRSLVSNHLARGAFLSEVA